MIAPVTHDDAGRSSALRQYALPEASSEAAFNRIARLAARLLAVPMACISPIDQDRHWLKACYGIDACQVENEMAACANSIPDATVLVVPDTRQDPRFAHHPLVTGAPGIRFYAGAPLITAAGSRLGTLCIMDVAPRALSVAQVATLSHLAVMVVDEFELRSAVTERKRTEEAQRFLASAGAVLTGSLDYETTLRTVAYLAIPFLTDWCIIDLLDEDGSVRSVAMAHTDPEKIALLEALRRRYPIDLNGAHSVARVLRTGESLLIPEMTTDMLRAALTSEEYVEAVRALGMRSTMCVPLVARGRTLGTLLFRSAESGRRFGPDDLALAEELARRAALAVDNARLYREEQAARRALQESEARLQLALEAGRMGTWEWDVSTGVINWPASLQVLYGLAPGTFGGTLEAYLALVHPDDRPALMHALKQALEQGGEFCTQHRMVTPDGTVHWLEVRARTVSHEDGKPASLLGVSMDVTERKVLEAELAHQAFHDPLTDLPNRTLLQDRLEHALARASRLEEALAVLFLDLDNFKVINDSLGHEVGDQLLVAVAERLCAVVRSGDTVARFGGDEFTVLLEDLADLGEATRIAQRIGQALHAPFLIGGRELVVTTSIGVALSTTAREHSQDLLRHADVALYQAKRQGKARYAVFDPRMQAQARERLSLEHDLRRALDRGEFRVYYQPVVDLSCGQMQEVEALVRWEHPERGLIVPADFMPVAEETGLIVPLDYWVLAEACRQVRAWQREYPGASLLMVSVNLSARQFRQPALAAYIAHVLDETGLAPHRLKVEITESRMMEDTEATAVTLRTLKAMGIALAIDDFGTGYSSLAYLKRFPVDALKIDRSFIRGLEHNGEDRALVRAVIAAAEALRLLVTAEGVETAEQASELRGLGCHRGQGYYFARPSPGEAIGALLTGGALHPNENPAAVGH